MGKEEFHIQNSLIKAPGIFMESNDVMTIAEILSLLTF